MNQQGKKQNLTAEDLDVSESVNELTESSHIALLKMIQNLFEKYDYEQIVQLAEKIPQKKKTPELIALLEKAQGAADEVAYLSLSIQDLQRNKDYHGLVPKLKEYLKLKPTNRKIRKLLEEAEKKARYSTKHGNGINAASNSMSAWIFEDATTMITVGLIAFALASAAITMYLRTGGRTIQVSIDDPTASVSIDGKKVGLRGGFGTTRLSLGERKVTVTLADGTVASGWDQFIYKVKRGQNVPLKIRLLPQKPLANVVKENPKPPLDANPPVSPSVSPGIWNFTAAGQLEENIAAVRVLQISPNGRQLYSLAMNNENTTKLWDLNTGEYTMSPFSGRGIYLSDQHLLFTGGLLQRYDLSNKKTIWKNPLDGYSAYVAATPDLTLAVAGGINDPFLYIYNLQTGQRLQKIDLGNITWNITIHPNGKTAWVGSLNEILIVDLQSWKVTERLKGQPGAMISLAFNSNGKELISGSPASHEIWFWDTTELKVLRKSTGHTRGITALSFLPGDQQIVSGASDKSLRLWDVATGKQLAVLTAKTNRFNTLAVSPDGKHVYTGGGSQYVESNKKLEFDGDYTIYKWRIEKGGQASILTPANSAP